MSADSEYGSARHSRSVLLLVLFASNVLASIDQSLMNIALDATADYFKFSLSIANWLVLGFSIVTGTVIMAAPSILAKFGLRKVMMFGYIASLAGSLIGFFFWDFASMLAARFIQAITPGLFFPIISTAIIRVSPEGKKATLLSFNSSIIGLGLAFSPVISGLLITFAGLRSIFLVPLVLSAILLVVGFFLLYNVEPRSDKKIDPLSVALGFVGLFTFMYGLNFISHELFPSVLFMVAGIAAIGLFAWRQTKIPDPLLDLRPLRNKSFTCGEIISVLTFMSSLFMSLLIPLCLEGMVGYTPFVAGCALIAPIVMYSVSSYLGGRIEDRFGIWPLLPAGVAVVLVGLIGVFATSSHMMVAGLLIFVGVAYFGVGLVYGPTKSRDLEAVRSDIVSDASSIHSTFAQVITSVASALFVGIMSGDVDSLMAAHISKADAYAVGFTHTLFIDIGITSVMLIASIFFARRMHAKWLAMPHKPQS